MKLILVTGMSGAGKSVALKTLEDSGFEAIDNLPLGFLPSVAESSARTNHLAIGADIRSRDFSVKHVSDAIAALKKNPSLQFTMLFLDCDDEVLRRRFTETRRRHPLALDRTVPDGIALERQLITKLRDMSDVVIDTSDFAAGDLRQQIISRFAQEDRALSVTLTSFSFKHGLPRDADIVFDVRFLKNPHYDEALRPLTGLDQKVGAYIETDGGFTEFFNGLTALLAPLLPRYVAEGKHYLTIAVGCTGGRHRSVHVVQKLAAFLQGKSYNVTTKHRDIAS